MWHHSNVQKMGNECNSFAHFMRESFFVPNVECELIIIFFFIKISHNVTIDKQAFHMNSKEPAMSMNLLKCQKTKTYNRSSNDKQQNNIVIFSLYRH